MTKAGSRIWYLANLANLLAMACHMAAPLLSVYWREVGLANWQLGWLAAGFSSAAILSRVYLGGWLERFGRRPFMMVGALMLAGLPGIYPFLENQYWPWLAVRVAQGFGLGLYFTTILTWVADNSPSDQIGRMQGVFGISGLLGSALGPYLLERVYQSRGFPAMFQVLFALGLGCLILVSMLPESHPRGPGYEPPSSGRLAPGSHWNLVIVTLAFGWLVGTVMTFIGPYLKEIGLPRVGLYYCGFAAASVAIRLVASRALDEFRIDRLVLLSGLTLTLSAVALSSLAGSPMIAWLALASVLNGVGHGFLYPSLSSYMVKSVPTHLRGAGLSLFTGTFDLGILAGAIVSGYLCSSMGYPQTFRIAALLLALGSLVFSMSTGKKGALAPVTP